MASLQPTSLSVYSTDASLAAHSRHRRSVALQRSVKAAQRLLCWASFLGLWHWDSRRLLTEVWLLIMQSPQQNNVNRTCGHLQLSKYDGIPYRITLVEKYGHMSREYYRSDQNGHCHVRVLDCQKSWELNTQFSFFSMDSECPCPELRDVQRLITDVAAFDDCFSYLQLLKAEIQQMWCTNSWQYQASTTRISVYPEVISRPSKGVNMLVPQIQLFVRNDVCTTFISARSPWGCLIRTPLPYYQ